MSAIECDHLTRRFTTGVAVDNLTFDVEGPGVIGVLGPNGAGKTTMMRMLTTALSPSGGRARVSGYDIRREPLAARKQIGFAAETVPLPGDARAGELLTMLAAMRGLRRASARTETSRVLDHVGLAGYEGRRIREMSKGQRQRIGLASALIGDPCVLILDEPTAGLDPEQVIDARRLIHQLGSERTVLFSSHLLPEVETICDRVLVIARGRRIAYDTVDGLRDELGLQPQITARTRNLAPTHATDLAARYAARVTRDGDHYYLTLNAPADTASTIARAIHELGGELDELRVDQPSLEDIFLGITNDHPT